jgi:hypothetical protein
MTSAFTLCTQACTVKCAGNNYDSAHPTGLHQWTPRCINTECENSAHWPYGKPLAGELAQALSALCDLLGGSADKRYERAVTLVSRWNYAPARPHNKVTPTIKTKPKPEEDGYLKELLARAEKQKDDVMKDLVLKEEPARFRIDGLSTGAHWTHIGHQYPAESKNRIKEFFWVNRVFLYAILSAPGASGWQGVGQSGYNSGFYLLVRNITQPDEPTEMSGTIIASVSSSKKWRQIIKNLHTIAEDTIVTPIKSEKAKNEMMAFLTKNFRALDGWLGGPKDNDFAYDHGSCRIGFDYGSGSPEREYAYVVCYWIALKVGRTEKFPNSDIPDLEGEYPYVVYDGDETWPVVLDTGRKLHNRVVVNSFGIRTYIHFLDRMTTDWKRIRKEMKRLNDLYEKEGK